VVLLLLLLLLLLTLILAVYPCRALAQHRTENLANPCLWRTEVDVASSYLPGPLDKTWLVQLIGPFGLSDKTARSRRGSEQRLILKRGRLAPEDVIISTINSFPPRRPGLLSSAGPPTPSDASKT
jgi:hypothetical protein